MADILHGHDELMAAAKRALAHLKDSNNCLSISQNPKPDATLTKDEEQIRLKLKVVKCSQLQSTICMHQKNDEAVVNNAPPPHPRFPCHPKYDEKRTKRGVREKRNIHGSI